MGQAPDMEPALLTRMQSNILTRVKAEDYEGAAERYQALSPDDRFKTLQYLSRNLPREDMKTFESAIGGETVMAMAPMVIESWAKRNAWVIGGVVAVGAAVWYMFGRKTKKKRKAA